MVVDLPRARGAFLGLAAGDAYGRPLEFIRPPQVRTHRVEIAPGRFKWTDDTHMALYLGRALLDVAPEALAPGALDESLVGHAIGARFVEWLDDPLMPFTAPGRTCITGAEAYRRSGDWRTSGVVESDGCGAVMRICPVALALDGEELLTVARVSAVVTHAHPNATATAAVATWLLRRVLEGAPLDAALVREASALTRARWPEAKDVVAALDASVVEAGAAGEWLDEAAIPAGDGGWRSPSALGLGLAAALRWGGPTPAAFATAVERAARIAGDSDSVACLTGMYLGAAHGEAVIPSDWSDALPQRGDLLALADALVTRDRERRAPRRARTSVTDPLYVDRVLPALGITFLPGKHAPSAFGRPWARDLGADLDRLVAWGTTLLVSLVEDHELRDMRVPTLVAEAERRGLRVLRSPVADGGVPTLAQAGEVVDAVEAELAKGKVVIHCRGGLGRAGTLASCVLVGRGMAAADAIAAVRAARPGAVETAGQEAFVERFAGRTAGRPT